MSNLTQELASEAVEAFLTELEPASRAALGDPHLERLHLLIQQAVSAGIRHAAERVEDLARDLRSEAGSAQIEL